MQIVEFLSESLSVGLLSVRTIITILSQERLSAFDHCTFHALLPTLMIRVLDLASRRTSVTTVVTMIHDQLPQDSITWVLPHPGSRQIEPREGIVGHAKLPNTWSLKQRHRLLSMSLGMPPMPGPCLSRQYARYIFGSFCITNKRRMHMEHFQGVAGTASIAQAAGAKETALAPIVRGPGNAIPASAPGRFAGHPALQFCSWLQSNGRRHISIR